MTRTPGRVLAQAGLAALVLGAIGAVSLAAGQPLLVPSLGAGALLQIHFPELPSARAWNTVAGQLCGVAAGFAALWLVGAAGDPAFAGQNPLHAGRVAATMLAIALTLILQTLLRAENPAGGATALIATLGAESADWAGLGRFTAAILLITVLGEAARRLVLRMA